MWEANEYPPLGTEAEIAQLDGEEVVQEERELGEFDICNHNGIEDASDCNNAIHECGTCGLIGKHRALCPEGEN